MVPVALLSNRLRSFCVQSAQSLQRWPTHTCDIRQWSSSNEPGKEQQTQNAKTDQREAEGLGRLAGSTRLERVELTDRPYWFAALRSWIDDKRDEAAAFFVKTWVETDFDKEDFQAGAKDAFHMDNFTYIAESQFNSVVLFAVNYLVSRQAYQELSAMVSRRMLTAFRLTQEEYSRKGLKFTIEPTEDIHATMSSVKIVNDSYVQRYYASPEGPADGGAASPPAPEPGVPRTESAPPAHEQSSTSTAASGPVSYQPASDGLPASSTVSNDHLRGNGSSSDQGSTSANVSSGGGGSGSSHASSQLPSTYAHDYPEDASEPVQQRWLQVYVRLQTLLECKTVNAEGQLVQLVTDRRSHTWRFVRRLPAVIPRRQLSAPWQLLAID